MCHGEALEGVVGPPLAGAGFLSAWRTRSLADLVDKIEKTMPPQAAGSMSRPQAIDLAAFLLRAGKFPAGQTDLDAAVLAQIAFPAAQAAAASWRGVVVRRCRQSGAVDARRDVSQREHSVQRAGEGSGARRSRRCRYRSTMSSGASTVYYGWQAVDQAALALVETAPLFLLPGRRCENGKPVPVDRADWKRYTAALMDVGREAYKAAQTRNVDAVVKVADRLNESCANCHKVYRDGHAREAQLAPAGASNARDQIIGRQRARGGVG